MQHNADVIFIKSYCTCCAFIGTKWEH